MCPLGENMNKVQAKKYWHKILALELEILIYQPLPSQTHNGHHFHPVKSVSKTQNIH